MPGHFGPDHRLLLVSHVLIHGDEVGLVEGQNAVEHGRDEVLPKLDHLPHKGRIIEQGTHAIDLIRWFLGEVREVTCMTAVLYFKEQKLDAKALADPKNWPAIGQATGAKYMVTGGLGIIPLRENPLSISITLTARIVSVDTGKAVAAGSADFVYPEKQAPAK